MIRRLALLLTLLGSPACTGGDGESSVDGLGASPDDDPVLLVGDVRHLVDRAMQERELGDRAAAARSVEAAYMRFRRDVRPLLFDVERRQLLAAEYHFGWLGTEIAKRSGEPAPHVSSIHAALQSAEKHAAAAREAPGTQEKRNP